MKKKLLIFIIFICLFIILYLLYYFNYIPHKKYNNNYFNIKTYISNIDKDNDEKKFMTQEIGKTTINTPTMQKDIAYDKVISKVHERNYPEEVYEHRIEE